MTQFQFHFGSIGRGGHSHGFAKRSVSIPLWFDWKQPKEIVECAGLEVSIPLWFDWKIHTEAYWELQIRFQFHFGSIGRMDIERLEVFELMFQFHFGSIGRQEMMLKGGHYYLFQFHFGSIGRRQRGWHHQKYVDVSIPLWFDWKKSIGEKTPLDIAFQFHFGSIGSQKKKLLQYPYSSFNSTLVRLEVVT